MNAKFRAVLKTFADMDRPDCDLREIAVQRGYASDLTILTSQDFRNIHDLYKSLCAPEPCDCKWCVEERMCREYYQR